MWICSLTLMLWQDMVSESGWFSRGLGSPQTSFGTGRVIIYVGIFKKKRDYKTCSNDQRIKYSKISRSVTFFGVEYENLVNKALSSREVRLSDIY